MTVAEGDATPALGGADSGATEGAVSGWWAASYIVLWGLVIALAVIVVALARQIGMLHLRLGPRGALVIDDEGPPLGEVPEEFDLIDL